MIDKLKGIEPVENVYKKQDVQRVDTTKHTDSISISAESQQRLEMDLAKKIAIEAPDIREDKVAEVRAKLDDPNYIKQAIEEIANKLLG